MKRFCKECGQEAQATYNVCIYCGTPLQANDEKKIVESPAPVVDKTVQNSRKTEQKQVEQKQTEQQHAPKKPMTFKQKLLLKVVAGVVVFLIGFSMWANSYQSSESVYKRFEAAVDKKDSKKLSKIMIHSDGSSIGEHEAQAFLALVEHQGKGSTLQLTTVVPSGQFLGIYDAHKIEAIDQLAYGYDIEGLSYTFNGADIDEFEHDEESVTFGPLAPGIYDVEVQFEGEYGDLTIEDTVTLDSYMFQEYTWMDIEIPIADVVFYVENYEGIDHSTTYVQVGGEKIPISDDGATDDIGPMVLDGSQQATVLVTMPWGDVESEPFDIDDSHMSIYARFVSSEQFEGALTVIEDFGEQYVQAIAEHSTKPLTDVSTSVKEYVTSRFDDYYSYSGKLETIAIDERSLFVDVDTEKPRMFLPVQYVLQDAHHDLSDSPQLSENVLTWHIGLSFNSEDKSWLIDAIDEAGWVNDFDATEEWNGSGKLYEPSEEAIAKAEDATFESELEEFINMYTDASVAAINYRDFDLVSDYITKDGPRRDEARDYIDYLDSKDIYESWLGSELENVEEVNDDTWKVTVIEEFEIRRPDSSDVKKFRTKLIIKRIDDELYVNELTETNPI